MIVNNLTIVHQHSDGSVMSAGPDFCKTPGAGVVPYVNTAFSKDLVNGSRTVTTNGVPAALKESEFRPSYGNEPGAGGGVVSGVNRGWAKFTNYSFDVKIEQRNAARLSDPMMMNGNGPNTGSPAETQGNLLAQGGLLCRIFCWCDQDKADEAMGKDFVQRMGGISGSMEA
ncbi:DUF4150 domain-containing protein [Burkholderia sp. FERM BP-3421]|uniref:DUF4150 domain-containing protein n=1 Tax=Burkholderia sp. FERM BP-3421 TaxID=1494466 RepID=UPI00235F76CA|nr:DUF4150 domain-containing protein [Burkholderia sp. FERM BP-3421]WDD92051.1 DUF4150 domain-containing protein [Burkholderia sp. FERM BP-3421]